jgi:hypothetical protein
MLFAVCHQPKQDACRCCRTWIEPDRTYRDFMVVSRSDDPGVHKRPWCQTPVPGGPRPCSGPDRTPPTSLNQTQKLELLVACRGARSYDAAGALSSLNAQVSPSFLLDSSSSPPWNHLLFVVSPALNDSYVTTLPKTILLAFYHRATMTAIHPIASLMHRIWTAPCRRATTAGT